MRADVYVYDLELFKNCFTCAIKSLQKDETRVIVAHRANREWRHHLSGLVEHFAAKGGWYVGYNNRYFDDPIMEWLIRQWPSIKGKEVTEVTHQLYKIGQAAINNSLDRDYIYNTCFRGLDLKKIGGLHKSLKLVAVNLGWPLIQEFPFDHTHEVQKDELPLLKDYNINDVEITEALYNNLRGELNLRTWITRRFKVNVLNEPRSGVANRLMEKFYSKATGQSKWDFKDVNTRRSKIPLKDVIFDDISFQTPRMQKFLRELKGVTLRGGAKLKKYCLIGKTRYKLAKGGLHSERDPEIFESTPFLKLIDADVTSYYPFIILNNNIKPEHLDEAFLKIFNKIVRTRTKAKYRKLELEEEGITDTREYKENKTRSKALKIVINAVYGKFGSKHHWFYDMLALYRVTLNGQLYLLMLIEALEEHGLEVFYANTDGITAKVRFDREEEFKSICKAWEKRTGFELGYDYYRKMIVRDVNNYIVQKESGKVKRKGVLDKNRHETLMKSYDKPVVPEAIEEFFINGVPIKETLRSKDSPMDFCMARRPGSKFEVYYEHLAKVNGHWDKEIEQVQRANRYFIGGRGGRILKRTKRGKEQVFAGTKGVNVALYNDAESSQYSIGDVDFNYYEKEIRKITSLFETQQLGLFD